MSHFRMLISLLAAFTLVSGCDRHFWGPSPTSNDVFGSGRVTTESRSISGFSGVVVSGAARLFVSVTGAESLQITADDNILPLLKAEVISGQLVLGPNSHRPLRPSQPVVYSLTVRTLSDLVASGATEVDLGHIDLDVLTLGISGASSVTASGTVQNLFVTFSGASRANLAGLTGRTVFATVSGASSAEMRVTDVLNAVVSGASILKYYGDPRLIQVVSGNSTLRRVGP